MRHTDFDGIIFADTLQEFNALRYAGRVIHILCSEGNMGFTFQDTRYNIAAGDYVILPNATLVSEFSDSEDPEADSLYDQNEYTSFTVSGTEKPEKKFCIAFVGEGNLTKKGYSALFENVGKNLQEDLKARQQLIGDTVITCTATYKDGSQKSVDIKVGTEILTGKEAGIDTTAEGKDEVTEDMAAKKDVYTTFEVQQ